MIFSGDHEVLKGRRKHMNGEKGSDLIMNMCSQSSPHSPEPWLNGKPQATYLRQ